MDDEWNITFDVDENLGVYWDCLPGMKQKRWFAKETHLKEHLQIQTLNNRSLEMLRTSTRGKKVLSNTVNYDILSNQTYSDQFFYQWMERRSENESSDMVAKILYMGESQLNKNENLVIRSSTKFLETLKTGAGDDPTKCLERSLFDIKDEEEGETNERLKI